LEILIGIGGDEVAHFVEWVDFAGNAVQKPVAPLTDSTNGLHFPNFVNQGQLLEPNLIFPIPSSFISENLPLCAVIRPINPADFTAVGVVEYLTSTGLFIGQTDAFMTFSLKLAKEADRARR
jgi:hypothetical protein